MSNQFYTATGNPLEYSRESSATMQQEFSLIQAGFESLSSNFAGFGTTVLVTGTNGGAVNAYTVTTGKTLKAYVAGMGIIFSPTITSTGAATVNVDGIGAVSLVSVAGAAPGSGDLVAGNTYLAVYNGTNAQLMAVTKNYVDANIASSVAAEASTRASADTTLQNNINSEASTRAANDATLQNNINAETTRAEAAEAALMPLAGGAFTGAVTVRSPTAPANPATKNYVDSAIYSGGAAPVWASGNTYTYGNVVFSPANFQTYRHVTASSAGTTDPSLDGTNWAEVGGGGVLYVTYDNRGQLRSTPGSNGSQAVVDGIGLFIFSTSSTATDDDETAFAATGGVWLLEGASWDAAFAYWLPDYWDNLARIEDLETFEGTATTEIATAQTNITTLQAFQAKFLEASFSMTLTTLAATTATDFTVTVTNAASGDYVVVSPTNGLGSTSADEAKLAIVAWVSAANTVTVSVRNPSAAAATITAGTWNVLVIKQ